MDKPPGGRGTPRGKGRGKREPQQQQQRPAQSAQPSSQPAATQLQSAPNAWNKRPQQPTQPQQQPMLPQQQPMLPQQQMQPQQQPTQPQQPGGNPWNKAAPPPAAAPQPQQKSGGAGDQPGTGAVRKQMSQLSIGASGDARGPPRKVFEKPEILKTRPEHVTNKKGTYGKVVKLDTNYFRFHANTNWSLYQYRVDFTPDEERTPVKRRLFNRIPDDLFVPNIFDGNVLTTIHYHPEPMEFTVAHTEDETKTVNIKIRFVAALQNKLDYGYFQLFNLLSRRGLENLKLKLFGRNYYDPQERVEVPAYKLEVWPGYLTNIRQHEKETLMCVEIVGKVMRQETIYDILVRCQTRNPRDFQRSFKMDVIGTVVLTNYTDRTYQIDDIDFNVTPSDTFEKDGQRVSYAQYMKDRYQVQVRNMRQPMLVSKANARQRRSGMPELIYLIPELCRATGLSDQMRNDFHLMKEVGQHTCCEPGIRIQRLLAFNQRLLKNERTQEQWKQWGLSLGKEIVQAEGRVMPPEEIEFGNNLKERNSDWTRAMQSAKPIVSQGKLDNWYILHPRNSRCIGDLKTMLIQASKGMRFTIGKPQEIALENDNAATYAREIENIMSKSTPQLIFCVVPNSQVPRYSTIKQKCCVDRPVPSQVVREQSITKRNALSIMTNVVIQMNCKIGGVPWKIALPSKDMMVIGFDVCHDTAKDGYDYGAVVASINPDCTKYYSSVIPHKKGEEICDMLAEHIIEALKSYHKANGKYPSRIFMYRDGVGEGQLNEVYKVEVQKVLGLLKNFCASKLTYIIVTKRISTRFFCNGKNPEAGTVLDDVITDPDKYDFFLVSAKATVGTITPTSYNIIHDDNRLTPEQLQRFTFKLTHLYFNTSKTVRVPAPCHYAHKLAFLVSQFIHRKPSESLSELLYFL